MFLYNATLLAKLKDKFVNYSVVEKLGPKL